MENQIKQLNVQVRDLKVRLFDAQEALQTSNQSFTEVMQRLIEVAKVQGDENGQVTIDGIVARVEDLVQRENSYFACQPDPTATLDNQPVETHDNNPVE